MAQVCCGSISSYKQDSSWSWFVCFCTTICMILTVGFTNALGVLFPVFMDSFEESRERTAWVTSAITGVNLFIGPVMGAFLNKFGYRITITLGCLTSSVGLALGSFASSSIILLYFIFSLPFAVGQSLVFVSSAIIATSYFDKRKSVALGIIAAGQGLGTMILGPTLQVLVDLFDWRNTFRVFAGLLTLASLTGCLLHQRTSSPDENQETSSKKFRLNLSLLKNPTVLVLVTTAGFFLFSRSVPYVHLIKHCDDLGIPAEKSSTVYLFIGLFASLGRIGGGFLSDMKYINTRLLLQAVIFIMGACTMLLTLAETYLGLAAYAIIFSTADGLMMTTFIVECLNAVDKWKQASVFGLQMMSSGIFALSSPPLAGLMADKFGNYTAAFLMAGGVGILASLIPFLLLCVNINSEELIEQNVDHHTKIDEGVAQVGRKDVKLQEGDEIELMIK